MSSTSSPLETGHLLLFNLAMDTDDPVLGFATEWVNALAEHWGRISVITMRVGRLDVRPNVRVHSVGAESRLSKPRRVARLYRLLDTVGRSAPIDACFSHMMPRFSVLAGPALRLRGVPLITWYAHPSRTLWLRAAHAISHRMVTSFPNAYPYKRDKLRVIGQAIDTALFTPAQSIQVKRTVLHVGRLSPVKNVDVLLDAFARVRAMPGFSDVQLAVVGSAPDRDRGYGDALKDRSEKLGIAADVQWIPGIPHGTLREWYRSATVHVNLTPTGFGDKVALESMSCGVPCLVANEDFAELLGDDSPLLLVPSPTAASLSERIARILATPASEQVRIGRALRWSVERHHSLSTLACRLNTVFSELGVRRARRTQDATGA